MQETENEKTTPERLEIIGQTDESREAPDSFYRPPAYLALMKLLGTICFTVFFYIALYFAINSLMFKNIETNTQAFLFCISVTGTYALSLFLSSLMDEINSAARFVAVGLGMALAFGACLSLADFTSPIAQSALLPIIEDYGANGFGAFASSHYAFSAPYQYLLMGFSQIPISPLYALKLPALMANVGLALALSRLSSLYVRNDGTVVCVFLAALALPSFIVNSAGLGLSTVIGAAFAAGGLYYAVSERPYAAAVLLAAAIAFDLNALVVFPALAVLFFIRDLKLRHLGVLVLVFLLCQFPALVFGKPLLDSFMIYAYQIGSISGLTNGAPGLYTLLGGTTAYQFINFGLFLTAAAIVLLVFYLYSNKDYLDRKSAVTSALLFALALPFMLPRMGPQAYTLACGLAIIYPAMYQKRASVTALVLTGSFGGYAAANFGAPHYVAVLASIALLAALTLVAVDLVRYVEEGKLFTDSDYAG